MMQDYLTRIGESLIFNESTREAVSRIIIEVCKYYGVNFSDLKD